MTNNVYFFFVIFTWTWRTMLPFAPAVPTYYIVLQQTRPTLEPTSCISTLAPNESNNIADPILHMKNPKVTYGKIWAETRKY